MKVMMFAKATRHTEAGQRPTREAVVAMHDFNEELQRAGVLLDLGGLLPSSRGVRVRYRGGKHTVVEGPFSETRALIAGYALIEVKTFAEAVEWAKRAPLGVGAEEVEVELRPIIDPTTFDPTTFDPASFDPGAGV